MISQEKYELMLERLFSRIELLVLDLNHGIYSNEFDSEKLKRVLDLQMDYFRSMLIDSIRISSKNKAWKLPIKLGKKTSGIGIDALIRQTETEISYLNNTQLNLLQIKDGDKSTPKKIKSLFSQLSFIQTKTKNVVMGQELKHRRDYHAELLWMSYQGEDFVKKIKTLGLSPLLTESDILDMDQNWMLHFVTYPRVEFVLSSSCCMVCQQYFKDLRHYFNQNKVYVPILIYSGMPTNNEEIHKSQLNLILFDGSFISTGIYIDTPYDSKIERKAPDYFKFIDLERVEACEDSISDALAFAFVHNNSEYQKKLINSLEEIFLKNGFNNPSDLSWLRSFLLRWMPVLYDDNHKCCELLIDKIEKKFDATEPQNIPPIEFLKQAINAQVQLLVEPEEGVTSTLRVGK